MGYKKDILGWMSEYELQTLEKLAQNVPANGKILEIGSMFGRSAVCWAMSADPSVTISCIDWFLNDMIQHHPYDDEVCSLHSFPLSGTMYDVEQAFINYTKEFTNIKKFKANSPYNLGDYKPELLDLLFLDAAHTNPSDWDNLIYFLPLMKKGGILCGHDYSDDCPDVKENVAKLETMLQTNVTLYKGTSIWSFVIPMTP